MTGRVDQLVDGHPFLADLDADQRARVARCARLVEVGPGTLLCAEGSPAEALFFLLHGHVSIALHDPGRGEVVVETVGPGGVVGWSWLLPPYRWSFDARASEPVTAIAVDAACLRRALADDPALGAALLGRVAASLLEKLQSTRLRLLDLYGDRRVP